MADESTENFNFVLPDVGASDGSWGGKLNTNFDEIDGILSKTLRAPASLGGEIPSVANRAGKALAFDADGNPVAITVSDSLDPSLRSDLAASTGGSLVAYALSGTGAVTRTLLSKAADTVSVKEFGAIGDGETDDTSAIQSAVNYCIVENKTLFFPEGVYVVSDTISYRPSVYVNSFAQGPRWIGEGPYNTVFDNRVSDGAFLDIDSAVDHAETFSAIIGTTLKGFGLKRTVASTGQIGINLRTCYHTLIEDIFINGLTGTGIKVQCDVGDNDGSVYLTIRDSTIFSCSGWGIDAKGASGHNEISFMRLESTWVQSCGTASATLPPPSGGVRWKGQSLDIVGCGFTVNHNVGLCIPGEAGPALTLRVMGTTFENNLGIGCYTNGLANAIFRNIQFHHNDSNVGTYGFYSDASTFAVRNIEFDTVLVRATSGNNPYTAFKHIKAFSDERRHIHVKNVYWDNFGYTGQTGIGADVALDRYESQCELTFSGAIVTLAPSIKGNIMPMRKRYSNGNHFESGDIVAANIKSAGLTANVTGLAAGTYNVYLADVSNVPTIEISSTSPVLDSLTGYLVKSTETGKLWVGRCSLTATSTLATGKSSNWCNPTRVQGGWMWADASDKLKFKAALNPDFSSLPTSDSDGIAQA